MNKVGRVNVLESLEHLVNNELDMNRLQDGRFNFDRIGQIAFHFLKRGVQIPAIRRKGNALDRHDILMTKLLKVRNLPERALCIRLVPKIEFRLEKEKIGS